jgi:hypothetical protein
VLKGIRGARGLVNTVCRSKGPWLAPVITVTCHCLLLLLLLLSVMPTASQSCNPRVAELFGQHHQEKCNHGTSRAASCGPWGAKRRAVYHSLHAHPATAQWCSTECSTALACKTTGAQHAVRNLSVQLCPAATELCHCADTNLKL